MHVIVATDGSHASLAGAEQFQWIADSREITDVTVVAVVSPYAAVPFANELTPRRNAEPTDFTFLQEEAHASLISLATGGRGLTSTILLGSTASRVQHSAPCPVLVCRPMRPAGT